VPIIAVLGLVEQCYAIATTRVRIHGRLRQPRRT
jgi:hypothetical protein